MGCNSSTPSSEPIAPASGAKGKGCLDMVRFEYFAGFGRGEPLTQMFTHHGQKFRKDDQDFGPWEQRKAAGDGGEFGGGLPQAFFTDKGKP